MCNILKKLVMFLLMVVTLGAGIMGGVGYIVQAEEMNNDESNKRYIYVIDEYDEPIIGFPLQFYNETDLEEALAGIDKTPTYIKTSDENGKIEVDQNEEASPNFDFTVENLYVAKIYEIVDEWNGIESKDNVRIFRVRDVKMDYKYDIDKYYDYNTVDFVINKEDEEGNKIEGATFEIYQNGILVNDGYKAPRSYTDINPSSFTYDEDTGKLINPPALLAESGIVNEMGIVTYLSNGRKFTFTTLVSDNVQLTADDLYYGFWYDEDGSGHKDNSKLDKLQWKAYDGFPYRASSTSINNDSAIYVSQYRFDLFRYFLAILRGYHPSSPNFESANFELDDLLKFREKYMEQCYLGEVEYEGKTFPSTWINGKVKNIKVGKYKTDSEGKIVLKDWVTYLMNKNFLDQIEDGVHYDNCIDPVITIKETKIPDGYYAKQTEYEVDLNDKEITIVNYKTKVNVAKIDDNNKNIPGAELEIRDSEGNKVTNWTTDGSVKIIEKLKVNEPYTISETTTPVGYKTASDISFTIKEDGTVESEAYNPATKTIYMVDEKEPTTVTITKELEGECDEDEFEFYIIPCADWFFWNFDDNRMIETEQDFLKIVNAALNKVGLKSCSTIDHLDTKFGVINIYNSVNEMRSNIQDFDSKSDMEPIYPYFEKLINWDVFEEQYEAIKGLGDTGTNEEWFETIVKNKWTYNDAYYFSNIYMMTRSDFYGVFDNYCYKDESGRYGFEYAKYRCLNLKDLAGDFYGKKVTVPANQSRTFDIGVSDALLIYEKDYDDTEEEEPKIYFPYEYKDRIYTNDYGILRNEIILQPLSRETDLKFTFTNKGLKVHPTGSAVITGKKTYNKDMREFSFVLSENGKELETVKNDSDGNIVFSDIEYNENDIGTHVYTITEKVDNIAGVEFDQHTETVTVNVSDNGDGTLKTDIKIDSDGVVFNNKYSASGSTVITGTKLLSGKDMDSFTFELKEDGKVIGEAVNDKDGKFVFDKIEYTLSDIGAHTYTISEKNDNKGGVAYDTHVESVTVNVSDNGDGTLKATLKTDNDGVVFNNKYSAKGMVTLNGLKNLEGKALTENQFRFALNDDKGNTLQETTNNINGEFSFDIVFDKAGVYNYSVSEIATNEAGIIYDEHIGDVTVEVSDNGDGTLNTDVQYDEKALEFTNKYSAFGETTITGKKILENKDMDSFSYILKEGDEVKSEATNDKDGNFSFDKLSYTLEDVGTHTYTITETNDSKPGITYDMHTETITVNVSDNGDGTLTTEIFTDEDGVVFTNTYNATGSFTITGTKKLEGRDLQKDEFSFILTDKDGKTYEAKSDENGIFTFESLNFTLENVGKEFVYTITEKNDKQDNITYDDHEEKLTLKISDNGDGTLEIKQETDKDGIVFTNKYTEPETSVTEAPTEAPKETPVQETTTTPSENTKATKTGDNSIMPFILISILAAAGLVTTGVVYKKKSKE